MERVSSGEDYQQKTQRGGGGRPEAPPRSGQPASSKPPWPSWTWAAWGFPTSAGADGDRHPFPTSPSAGLCPTLRLRVKPGTSVKVASAGSALPCVSRPSVFPSVKGGFEPPPARSLAVPAGCGWVWLECSRAFPAIAGALEPPPAQPLLGLRPSWRDKG